MLLGGAKDELMPIRVNETWWKQHWKIGSKLLTKEIENRKLETEMKWNEIDDSLWYDLSSWSKRSEVQEKPKVQMWW